MTGKKKRTVYRKTRKRKGHGGDRKKAQLLKKSGCNRKSEPNEPTPGTSHDQSDLSDFGEESDQLPSSSRKKMRFQSSEDESSSSSDENKKVFEVAEVEKGYRLVDLKSFSSVLSTLHKCEEDNCIMSQLPVVSKQEQKDKGYLRLFLTFSALTKDFFVTILRKGDEIDLEEYLTAVEKKFEGSHCVWNGFFRGISQNLSGKLAVSMNAKAMDISREDLQRSDSVDAKLKLKSHEDPQQEYQRPDFFNVNLKSGSIGGPKQFDKEKIEEMNFGESKRFTLLPDCNASRIALTLTVTDGKYTVLDKDLSIDLSVSSTKPSGEKIAVENPPDDLQDREGYSEQEPLLP